MEDYYNLLAEAYEAEDLFWKEEFEEMQAESIINELKD